MVTQWIFNCLANSQFLYDLFCEYAEDAGLCDKEKPTDDGIPDRRRRRPRRRRTPRRRRSARTPRR